jgi:NAD(P)-dependent dehydrogenase (short-subunit alcohol dehydrogenase family)
VAAAVTAAGGSARAHGIDLLDIAAVQSLRDSLLATFGRVDVLVHLVGGWRGTTTLEVASVENWHALHPPIVGTLATLTAVFGPDVQASPAGRVFMVTSTTAAAPTAGNIAYASAKAAAETWMGGVAHYLRDSEAASVTVAVKALLTDGMIAGAAPGREWAGYTHVRDLARAITVASTTPVPNGSRLDLTTEGYSPS